MNIVIIDLCYKISFDLWIIEVAVVGIINLGCLQVLEDEISYYGMYVNLIEI